MATWKITAQDNPEEVLLGSEEYKPKYNNIDGKEGFEKSKDVWFEQEDEISNLHVASVNGVNINNAVLPEPSNNTISQGYDVNGVLPGQHLGIDFSGDHPDQVNSLTNGKVVEIKDSDVGKNNGYVVIRFC